jgi:hypothetical protein
MNGTRVLREIRARSEEGAGVMQVFLHDGQVVFDLGRTARVVRLPPDQAMRMAEALYHHAVLLITGAPPARPGIAS